LVSTPKTAKYQDALAFTRSLGDLHLHTYGNYVFPVYDFSQAFFSVGVTHLPEIQRLDLETVFQMLSQNSFQDGENTDNSVTALEKSTICIVVATDGVWDNWLYEDVSKFMFDKSNH
jgi:hypothetical protein